MSKPAALPEPDPLFFPEGTSAAEAAAQHGSVITGLSMGAGQAGISSDRVMQEAVQRLMGDVADPHFQRTVEETLQEMASGAGDGTAGGRDAADPLSDGHIAASVFSSLAAHSGAAGAQAIAQTMGMMSRLGGGVGAADAPQPMGALPGSDAAQTTEALSDELIKNMMSEFEGMGKKEDFAAITDNMMRQLLSKDIMYEPMRSITERFPEWLAVHAERLDKKEYDNYGNMYMTFQKLVLAYETDPDNFPRMLELFQDLQDTGNPPLEIIKALAPALELTADGMPAMMPGMGPGMPEAGGGGLPAAGCSIA